MKAAALTKKDVVLEVGPGKGVLTELLLQQAGHVIAVEKDKNLVQYLKEKFADAKNLTLLQGDILKLSNISEVGPPKYLKTMGQYVIVANLPYYITSRFLRMALEGTLFSNPASKQRVGKNHEAGSSSDSEKITFRPMRMVVMVQKEVAERIVAMPPHMNLLGVSVQAYGTAKIVLRVPREQFSPPPKVDSAVVSISDISDHFFQEHDVEPKQFFTAIKKAFSQKRKMLRNSIKLSGVEPPTILCRKSDFRHIQELMTKRPQELSLKEWVDIIHNRICLSLEGTKTRPK